MNKYDATGREGGIGTGNSVHRTELLALFLKQSFIIKILYLFLITKMCSM
jgi:hypothetical protein